MPRAATTSRGRSANTSLRRQNASLANLFERTDGGGRPFLVCIAACSSFVASQLAVLDGHNFGRGRLPLDARRHRRGDPGRGAVGDGTYRIVRQVRIDFGGPSLLVPEHFADQVKTVAVGDGERREAVPQIVDTHSAEPGARPHPFPIFLQARLAATSVAAGTT